MNGTQSNISDEQVPVSQSVLDDQQFFLLIVEARAKGYCTPDDIMRYFPDAERSVEMTERLLDLGVELRKDDSPEAALHALKVKGRKQLEQVLEQEKMSAIDLYFKDLGSVAVLTPEEEGSLVERAKSGDESAFRSLIDANQRLVVSVAKNYLVAGAAIADLIQEGNIGLIKAAKLYDPQKGGRFAYYAAGLIQKAIKQYLTERSREHYVPDHVVESLLSIRNAKDALFKELRREPTAEELSARVGVSVEHIQELKKSSWLPVSLDAHIGDSTGRIMDSIPDAEQENAGAQLVDNDLLRERLEEELAILPDDERQVMRLKYGFTDGREWGIDEIAVFQGRSKDEVKALCDAAVHRLREHIEEYDLGELFEN